MSENAVFLFEKRGAAFWITINRPDKRNALRGDYSGLIIVLLWRTIIVGVVFGVARGAAESLELGSTGIEKAMPLSFAVVWRFAVQRWRSFVCIK